MSQLCVPSTAVRDRGLAMARRQDDPQPELIELLSGAVIHEPTSLPGQELAGVDFWVPDFLGADPVLYRGIVAAMPGLRVIQAQTAGVDVLLQVLPDGVELCDARGVHGSSTAEWALTALLSVFREFPRFERARQQRRWDYSVTDELAGKRVLIVGAGDVGQQLARRITACDAIPVLVARTAREGVFSIGELPDLLPGADAVVLIVPKTPETVGMVDAAFLAAMPDGAVLVNAARGPVVHTAALLAELTSGRLRAAVDVVDPEPLPSDHPLWLAPNLLLTPHVAGSVLGFGDRFAALLVSQLHRYLHGEQLANVVTGEY
ncbi:2-hydroxyacid dehydrogenase [Jatrophihabitans sp.]|uniref:2-hydroxyacid dehydrogenase n=1 Tax=Jatrophihabitans sp. TaxID=1932789 RepID=UPI002D17082A|nr:2-hydroxyacid dehydrogenase [Jatrophihabitans sp.]